MKSLCRVLAVAILLQPFLTVPSFAISEAQLAYNACTKSYNEVFRGLKGYKAIVSGVTGSTFQCFWSWGAKTQGEALNRAVANCERIKVKCYVYADSNGVRPWSRRISDLGGSDGSRERGQARDAEAAALFNGLVNGLVNGLNSGGGSGSNSQGSRPRQGGSSGRNNCPGATIAVDENCRPLH